MDESIVKPPLRWPIIIAAFAQAMAAITAGVLVSLTQPILMKLILPRLPETETATQITGIFAVAVTMGWSLASIIARLCGWRWLAAPLFCAKFLLALVLLTGMEDFLSTTESLWNLALLYGGVVFVLCVSQILVPYWLFSNAGNDPTYLVVLIPLGIVGYVIGCVAYSYTLEPYLPLRQQMQSFAVGLAFVASLEVIVFCLLIMLSRCHFCIEIKDSPTAG